tara:strand:+ start:2951 stop:4045 length:1095 start_codon:yes stop_codon:yes gene_type:complete
MKILFDHKIFWLQKYGGISRYFVNLLKFIELKKKIQIKVFSVFYRNHYLKNEINQKYKVGTFIDEPVPKTSFFLKFMNDFFFNFYAKKYKPDLIHTTYFNHKINYNVPLILTVYDLIHEKTSKKRYENFLPKKNAISRADHIICISKQTRADLHKFYNYPKSKSSVIHLGADHLKNLRSNNKSNLLNKKYILYIGSREKYKNFNVLINSLKQLKKKDFILVCFGGKKFTNEELNLNKSNIKIKQIFGDDLKLKNLLEKAICLVNTSKLEGFSIPNVEAMSLGCPLICSDIPIFKEICKSSVLYFDVNSSKSLAKCLNKIMINEKIRKKLIINGKKRSLYFKWKNCTNQTIDVYNNVLKSSLKKT